MPAACGREQIAPDEPPIGAKLAAAAIAPWAELNLAVGILLVRLGTLKLLQVPVAGPVAQPAPTSARRASAAGEVGRRSSQVVGPRSRVGIENGDEVAPVIGWSGGAQGGALPIGGRAHSWTRRHSDKGAAADHPRDLADADNLCSPSRRQAGSVGRAVIDHSDLEPEGAVGEAVVLSSEIGEQARDDSRLVAPGDHHGRERERAEP